MFRSWELQQKITENVWNHGNQTSVFPLHLKSTRVRRQSLKSISTFHNQGLYFFSLCDQKVLIEHVSDLTEKKIKNSTFVCTKWFLYQLFPINKHLEELLLFLQGCKNTSYF